VLEGYAEVQRELALAGAITGEMTAPFWAKAMEIFAPIQAREAADLHAGHYDEFEPAIRERLRWGASVTPEELLRLRASRRAFCAEMDTLLARFDMLAMPAAPVAKLGRGADHAQTRARLLRYTTPASLAGLPAVVIPSASGLGGGAVQLIAAAGRDAALLAWSAKVGEMRRLSR
jgi:Asp-tRNA(Asn)/Glu-tRNA(Gln) amidotransferase A subunit family amidase